LPVLSYQGKSPKIHKDAFISALATVIGDVEISEGASVFPGVVIRGDLAKITIGKYSNIQDNAVLHGSGMHEEGDNKEPLTVEIGDYVTVGHGAVVHSSKVEDVSLIGINAVIFGDSVIGEGSIVGMNATVLENTKIPKRSIVVGTPARVVKTVDDATFSRIKEHALRYHELAKSHRGIIF